MEQAYAFFHQKYRVYEFSPSEPERDNIEYAISSYLDRMSPELYLFLSGGREGFLREHGSFPGDMREAISLMEESLGLQ